MPLISPKSHNREVYVPSIMEECAPQTHGSAQVNILLVSLETYSEKVKKEILKLFNPGRN
jgi:hypothetical protein